MDRYYDRIVRIPDYGVPTLESIPEVSGPVAGITQTADSRIWTVIRNKGIYRIEQDKGIESYPSIKTLYA